MIGKSLKFQKLKFIKISNLIFSKQISQSKLKKEIFSLQNLLRPFNFFLKNPYKNTKTATTNTSIFILVQVGIKPLTKEGLNTSILAVLRDARFQNFQDFLLSSIESNLCNGPVSFDCYPNHTISLKD